MPKVAITDTDIPNAQSINALEHAGFSVVHARSAHSADIIEAGQNADALIVQWATIDREILDSLTDVKVISRLGIGYDMIDVDHATRRGIAVTNTPSYCVDEVAAHAVAMIMALSRNLPGYDRAMRSGQWSPTTTQPAVRRPSDTVVAVLGYGRIGALTAQHCQNLGFKVVVYDPYVDPSAISAAGHMSVTLEEALAWSNAITLHVPLNSATHHIIGEAAFSSMLHQPFIVNTCRGGLIDEDALIKALDVGVVSGAALDVFSSEPLAAGHILRTREDVLLSPHAAWYSQQSLESLPTDAAENIINFFSGLAAPVVNPKYANHQAAPTAPLASA